MENPQDPYQSPTTAGQAAPPIPTARSGIPKVFGIIHIIYAAIGGIIALLGLGGGAILRATADPLRKEAEKTGEDISGLTEGLDGLLTASMIQSGFSVIFAIVLLISGIQLVRYKASGRMLSNVWAVGRIVVAIPVTFMVINAQTKFQEEIQKLSEVNDGLNMGAIMGGAGVIGILIVSIYPVLSLIFVNQQKAKEALN